MFSQEFVSAEELKEIICKDKTEKVSVEKAGLSLPAILILIGMLSLAIFSKRR